MKKLIGRIFRDEHGVETIERVSEPVQRYISRWELEREDACVLATTCPRCKHSYRVRFSSAEDLDEMVNTLSTRGWPTKNYCSYCGAHNIFSKEIKPF